MKTQLPRPMLTGRGFPAISEGGPPTAPHKQRVFDVVAPALAPLGSVVGFSTTRRVMALTYDDGPDPSRTPIVLDELAASRSRATFFMLVQQAEAFPELARRVVAEGHEVGLHGIDHSRLTSMPIAEVRRRTSEGKRRLEDLVGVPVRYFRPPYGAQNKRSFLIARATGMDVIAWSVWGRDWEEQPASAIAQRLLRGLAPGGIALLHDAYAPEEETTRTAPTADTGATLRHFLDGLTDSGYAIAPLAELLASAPAIRMLWFHP